MMKGLNKYTCAVLRRPRSARPKHLQKCLQLPAAENKAFREHALQGHPEEYGEAEANPFSQYVCANYNLGLILNDVC